MAKLLKIELSENNLEKIMDFIKNRKDCDSISENELIRDIANQLIDKSLKTNIIPNDVLEIVVFIIEFIKRTSGKEDYQTKIDNLKIDLKELYKKQVESW